MPTLRALSLTLVFAMTVFACAGSRQVGICRSDLFSTPSAQGDAAAALSRADAAWTQRSDEAKVRETIAALEEVVAIDPGQANVYPRLARANYFLADAHIRFDEEAEEEMLSVYEKGTYYAEMGLAAVSDDFRGRKCSGESTETIVGSLGEEAVTSMYWYATNLGKWALAKGILVAIGNKDDIFAMMTQVETLDPDFFHGATGRYFGAYYTKIPFPGGDPELSRANFDKSIDQAPNYLATRVLLADYLATKIDDAKTFEEQLTYVLKTSPDMIPDLAAENAVEQRKAQLLLEDFETYFELEDGDPAIARVEAALAAFERGEFERMPAAPAAAPAAPAAPEESESESEEAPPMSGTAE